MIANKGKTIQIYCPTGDPRGLRIAEITTSVPQAIVIPRTELAAGLDRVEISRVGLYLLFGPTDEGTDEQVYIGEADDCAVRLDQHAKDQDKRFWQNAVVIVSAKDALTKAHGRLLEHWAIGEAKKSGRYQVTNGTAPKKPPITEPMEADCADVFEVMRTLLTTLGYPVFEPLIAPTTAPQLEFVLKYATANARAVYTAEGMVVKEGSIARGELTPSAVEMLAEKRKTLIEEGVLVADGPNYRFSKDHLLKTPSAAAAMVAGAHMNGWDMWVTPGGKTLDEVVRKEPKT